MSQETWNTSITSIQPNEIRLRGYRIEELMGQVSFTQTIFLAIMGELPAPPVARLVEAILVSSIDHGASPPSALAARTSASTGASLNAAVACGLLSINRLHGGAIEDCMVMLEKALSIFDGDGRSAADHAADILADYSSRGQRLPGLGHRLHSDDPRTHRLFSMAAELGLSGAAVELIQALQLQIEASGKKLPINVDGAIAALLVDLSVPSPLANAFFFMARIPGLVAHVFEEQNRQKPMRRIHPTAHEYDGPAPRQLDEP